MSLTPEQVLNKEFQTTQFRRGYDERDVDDFLDEVVAEMRSLIAQRDDYKDQLNDCRAGRGLEPVEVRETDADDAAVEQAQSALSSLEDRIAAAKREEQEAVERAAAATREADEAQRRAEEARQAAAEATELRDSAQAAAPLAPPSGQEPGGAVGGVGAGVLGAAGGASAAGIIELAQRLHDEHIAKGEARRAELVSQAQARHDELLATGQSRHDELLASGQSRHDELIGSAQRRHDELIADAESRSGTMVSQAEHRKAEVLGSLEHDKQVLEAQIDELRGFERTYRGELRSFLEHKLEELDHAGESVATQGGDHGAEPSGDRPD